MRTYGTRFVWADRQQRVRLVHGVRAWFVSDVIAVRHEQKRAWQCKPTHYCWRRKRKSSFCGKLSFFEKIVALVASALWYHSLYCARAPSQSHDAGKSGSLTTDLGHWHEPDRRTVSPVTRWRNPPRNLTRQDQTKPERTAASKIGTRDDVSGQAGQGTERGHEKR